MCVCVCVCVCVRVHVLVHVCVCVLWCVILLKQLAYGLSQLVVVCVPSLPLLMVSCGITPYKCVVGFMRLT